MTWIDHRRRAAAVLLVVSAVAVALLAVPAVASATFGSSRAAAVATTTDRMETPSGITGTYRCTRSGHTESIAVTVTTFTDTGPAGSSYGFSLGLGSTVKDTASGTSRSATLGGSATDDGASTTWTVGIQGNLSRWTSDVGSRSIVCPATGTRSGSF